MHESSLESKELKSKPKQEAKPMRLTKISRHFHFSPPMLFGLVNLKVYFENIRGEKRINQTSAYLKMYGLLKCVERVMHSSWL